jgi:SAM-dependent methyltransferase
VFRPISTPLQSTAPPDSQFTVLAEHYDELMDVVPYAVWAEYVCLLFEIAGAHPRTVLDCACGTGNVSFELARSGFVVTGVDLSAAMIEAAQRKASAAGFAPRFVCADLTDFDLGQNFDAATCLYDSFNYILDAEKLQRAFERIAAHLRPGGIFVFDMNTPWAFEQNLFTQRNRDPRKNLHYDWRARFDPSTRVCEVTMLFERKKPDGTIETFSEVHHERAYTRAEVTAMLVQSGWQLLKTFDAYTTNAPHARSERWFFVARRN